MVSKSPEKSHSKPPLSAREPTVFSPPKLDDSISFNSPKHSPKVNSGSNIFSPQNSPLTSQQLYPQHQQEKTIRRTSSHNTMINSKSSPSKSTDKSSIINPPILATSSQVSTNPITAQRTSTVNLVLPVSSNYESKVQSYYLQQPSYVSHPSYAMGDNSSLSPTKKDDSFTLNSPNTKIHQDSNAGKTGTPAIRHSNDLTSQQSQKSIKRTGSHGVMIGSSSNLKMSQKQALFMSPRSSDF